MDIPDFSAWITILSSTWAVGGWMRRRVAVGVADWDFSNWIVAYAIFVAGSVAFIASLYIWRGWFIEVLARVLG